MCFYYQGRVLETGEQQPLSFDDTTPPLFANVVALETMVFQAQKCKDAYNTLFKACVWNGLFYGGSITIQPTSTYVLEVPPAGFNDPPTISARGIHTSIESTTDHTENVPSGLSKALKSSARDVPFNSTTSTSDYKQNVCFDVIGHTTKPFDAESAAFKMCNLIVEDVSP